MTIQFEENGLLQSSVTIPKFTNGNLRITLPVDLDEFEDNTVRTLLTSASFTGLCGNRVPELILFGGMEVLVYGMRLFIGE